ncbi:MAG: helix-hairpin-helix domain-containing protein [Candidatus Dormibacteraeota bacterium]|nr:helix-hairpin-helix domain-containing protein [Candidatus Dormibacteraeota bacterium]
MASRIWFLPGWWRLVLLALPLVISAGVLAAVFAFLPSPQAPAARVPPAPSGGAADAAAADALPAAGGLLVSVTGAVANPGLYRVAKGERASAAIAAAGGLTADADPNRMPNLAARLKDGQEVKVPARTAPARGAASSRTTRVSLNAATTDELAAVPGFTADLAEAAVRYRQDYGGFSSMRELVTVLGMGEADYLIARSYLTV